MALADVLVRLRGGQADVGGAVRRGQVAPLELLGAGWSLRDGLPPVVLGDALISFPSCLPASLCQFARASIAGSPIAGGPIPGVEKKGAK